MAHYPLWTTGGPLTTSLAPIALFAYKRPDHTARALDSLAQNPEFSASPLFIYCDSAKHAADAADVERARQVIRNWPHPKKTVIERSGHLGLAASVITGVTDLAARFGRLIVVEDDLIVSSAFLKYLNYALGHYVDDVRVMQISAYMFPVPITAATDAVMLPFTTSWGWATWDRSWQHFDPGMSGYDALEHDSALRHRFDLNGSYPYFRMLRRQARGTIDSWAIRWYKSVFFRGGLALYPRRSLVKHAGFGHGATHARRPNRREPTELWQEAPAVYPSCEVDHRSMLAVCKFLRSETSVQRALITRLASLWPIRPSG